MDVVELDLFEASFDWPTVDLDWFLLWALFAAMDYFLVDRIDSVFKKEKKVIFIPIHVVIWNLTLTEGLKFVEADGALALRCLDAARVEDMVTLEEPNLLLVPLEVEAQFAAVASVWLVDHAALQVPCQDGVVALHVPHEQSLRCQQDLLSVGLLANFVLKRLFELFELHVVALFLQVRNHAV